MIKISENDDVIDICRDNVFKAVFTKDTPESRGALSKLLSAVIGREVTVTAIVANEPPIDPPAGFTLAFTSIGALFPCIWRHYPRQTDTGRGFCYRVIRAFRA